MKIFAFLFFVSFNSAFAFNLKVIEKNSETGFAIYRLGFPEKNDIKALCNLGVQEIMVLSGNAEEAEKKHSDLCPSLKVVYNEKQSHSEPVTKQFLERFDQWVSEAKQQGKKIAFRCNCGCHRTGRLAAYYQMKYQNLSLNDALYLMRKHGKFMAFFPSLIPQVKAMKNFINGESCQQDKQYCVLDK